MEDWWDIDPSWDIFSIPLVAQAEVRPPLEVPEPYRSEAEEEEWQRQFRTDLFDVHSRPFAFYLEPEAFAACEAARMTREKLTVRFVRHYLPKTTALAERVLELIPQRELWGKQADSGKWPLEEKGKLIRCGTRKKTVFVPVEITGDDDVSTEKREVEIDRFRPGRALALLDLVKHFAGWTNAVGTTDLPRKKWESDPHSGASVPRFYKVACLRIDVDQDAPWKRHNPLPIIAELWSERRIAASMGLPYHAFRTGKRGFQAVLPYPVPVFPSVASFLLESYLAALEERPFNKTLKIDANNLHVPVMRFPGGRHSYTESLGLWIDIDNERLFPVNEQARMMVDGFRFGPGAFPEQWDVQQFDQAAAEIAEYVEHVEHVDWSIGAVLKREQVAAICAALPDNALVRRSLEVLGWVRDKNIARAARLARYATPAAVAIASEATDEDQDSPDFHNEEVASRLPEAEAEDEAEATPEFELGDERRRSLADWTPARARRLWTEGFQPGGFHEWISMEGKGGILAAVILFGKEGAVEKLVELAIRTDARSEADREARIASIHSYWDTFWYKDFMPYRRGTPRPRQKITGEITGEVVAIAGQTVQELRRLQPKARWSPEVTLHTVLLLLIALRDSPTGTAEVSFRDLAESINDRWPEGKKTNHMRVKEVVERITQGDGCLYLLLYRKAGAAWNSEPDQYRAGRELKKMPFGRLLEERRRVYVMQDEEAEE